MSEIRPKLAHACDWIRLHTRICGSRCCAAMAGDVNHAARCRTWKSTTKQFRSHSGDDSEENLITLCCTCHASMHGEMK